MTIERVMHININCRDLEESIAFYELLGFEVVLRTNSTAATADGSLEVGLGLDAPPVATVTVMAPAGSVDATRSPMTWNVTLLDLMHWERPGTSPAPARGMAQQGVARVALYCSDLLDTSQRLIDAGTTFVSAPQLTRNPNGTTDAYVCFVDPNGVVVELVQFATVDPDAEVPQPVRLVPRATSDA